MFTFFTALADAYSKVLMPPKTLSKRLQGDASDRPAVLDRCLKRLEWERTQERCVRACRLVAGIVCSLRRSSSAARARMRRTRPRLSVTRWCVPPRRGAVKRALCVLTSGLLCCTPQASIDWHDFVVVETIDFYNEEDDSLPAPLSLSEVVAQLRASAIEAPAAAEAQETTMDVEMDEEERTLLTDGVAAQQPPALPAAPAPEPQMKIVRNYKRPGQAAAGPDSMKFVVSPITGELVPVDQMAEHMRISLIDPKWREQREAMLGKLRGSTVASDEEIAKNVISLARTRPDIFGSTDEEVSVAVAAELEAKKTAGFEQHPHAPPPPHSGMQQMRPPAGMPMPPRPYGAPGMPMMPLGYGQGMPPPGMPGMPPPGMPGMPPPGMPGMPPRPLGAPPGMMPYPPPMPYGAPMMGGGMMPPMHGEEPDAKRQRTEDALVSEEDFAEAHPDPVTVEVTVPAVEGDASMTGQTVSVEVASVMETVGDVKARLAALLGVAASKQKLSTAALGFLKDTSTLAAYNFGSGTAMIMGLKERGGRTKK
jgi:splicing factor 3A subunit 1